MLTKNVGLYTEVPSGFPGLPRCEKHRMHLLSPFMLRGIERKYPYSAADFITAAKSRSHSRHIMRAQKKNSLKI
jgi:hypothetical protein